MLTKDARIILIVSQLHRMHPHNIRPLRALMAVLHKHLKVITLNTHGDLCKNHQYSTLLILSAFLPAFARFVIEVETYCSIRPSINHVVCRRLGLHGFVSPPPFQLKYIHHIH